MTIPEIQKPHTIFTDYVEQEAISQFIQCMNHPGVIQGALMPDVHAGYTAPIGSVLLTQSQIFPSFVGYDIGCGMCAAKLSLKATDITKAQLELIRDEILLEIPIGKSHNTQPQYVPYDILAMPMTPYARELLNEQGSKQLCTLGGGNHFIEIGTTTSGDIAIVVHSGSRGIGYKIASLYMRKAAEISIDTSIYEEEFESKHLNWLTSILTAEDEVKYLAAHSKYLSAKEAYVHNRVLAKSKDIEKPYSFATNSELGIDYINDMNMCLQFALANRSFIIDKVVYIMAKVLNTHIDISNFINKNHNHAELYNDKDQWVHRKGATQATAGTLGVIPGNMVDGSFIVMGKGNESSLCSSSHGAGRVLSRKRALSELSLSQFKLDTSHLVANHSDSNIDESPKSYKPILEVMANQADLVEVIDRVTPILNIKGPS